MRVIPPREGEVIGDAPDRRVEILSDHDSLHATWSRFGPHRRGANLHIHHRHSDLFYVLTGELTVKLGPDGDETRAPAGTLARVPPLVVHGFRNGSDAEVRYLNFHAPGQGFADYMRGLSDFDQDEPPPDGGRPASEAPLTSGDGVLCDVDEIGIAVLSDSYDTHVHREHVESFFVLEGELVVNETRAAAGTWLQIPPGLPHAVSGSARYLDVHTPGFGLGARDLVTARSTA
jgi:mannose-6-phosphate isomerase-like protein (cupin superfamily)